MKHFNVQKIFQVCSLVTALSSMATSDLPCVETSYMHQARNLVKKYPNAALITTGILGLTASIPAWRKASEIIAIRHPSSYESCVRSMALGAGFLLSMTSPLAIWIGVANISNVVYALPISYFSLITIMSIGVNYLEHFEQYMIGITFATLLCAAARKSTIELAHYCYPIQSEKNIFEYMLGAIVVGIISTYTIWHEISLPIGHSITAGFLPIVSGTFSGTWLEYKTRKSPHDIQNAQQLRQACSKAIISIKIQL